MKVGLFAADLSHKHGWARYSLNVVKALQQTGIEMVVIASGNSPLLPAVEVHQLLPNLAPMDQGLLARQLLALPRVRTLLRGCHVIHSLVEPFAPLGALVAGSRPYFVTGHGSYVRAHHMRRPPASWVYASAFQRGTMICVSRYTQRVAQQTFPTLRTAVINNGVDVERFSAVQHIGGEVPTVLFVGAVKARKGVIELIRAMVKIREAIPNIRCRIIGELDSEPDYVERVRSTAAALNLSAVVEITGRVADEALLDAYARADVFALPSLNVGWKFEGFGLSLLEASAAGLPVVGSRDCGAEDAVVDGVTGLLVAQMSLEDELADAIIRLLSDRTAAKVMGDAGREYARAHTWTRAAARLVELYEAGKA